MATSAGALAAMSPWTLVIMVPIVAVIVWRTRYVSLGSISGALGAPIVTAILAGVGLASVPAIAYALASGLLVTVAHADNIGRLRAGTERKIGQKEQVGSVAEAEVEVEVRNPSGLHARPAATFVRAAGGFGAEVAVTNLSRDADRAASAKSVLGVMGLAVACGHRIRIAATGEDAERAVAQLAELVASGLGEEIDAA